MRGRSLLVALALAVPSVAAADFERRPYLQDVRPDSALLMWKNQTSTPATITVDGPGGSRTIDVKAGLAPRVRVDGLAPATRYRYKVRSGGEEAGGELTTAPEPGAQVPVTFVVYGDNRSDVVAHYEVVERIRAEAPDFMLNSGDMVDDGGEDWQWKKFFEIEGPLLADNVLYPALGNHDIDNDGHEWIAQLFHTPPEAQAPGQYAITYGPVRVLVLESNTPSFAMTDQTAWLERQLAAYHQDPRMRHLFVVMHHPVYSISSHGGLPSLREKWAPLFEQYGATAVFSGHDHNYQRAENHGVHYFVTGGGGAPLYGIGKRVSRTDESKVARFEKVNHYLRVHVMGDLAEVTAVRVDGTPIETIRMVSAKSDARHAPEPAVADVAAAAAAVAVAAAPVAADSVPPAPAPAAGGAVASEAAETISVDGERKLPPTALLMLAGLALLGAAGLWRLTRPTPARAD